MHAAVARTAVAAGRRVTTHRHSSHAEARRYARRADSVDFDIRKSVNWYFASSHATSHAHIIELDAAMLF